MASGNIQIPPPPSRSDYKSEWYFKKANEAYYKQWGDLIKARARAAAAGAQADEQAGAEAQRRRQELIDYQNSPLGQTMTVAKSGPSFIAGGFLGGLEANELGKRMMGKGGIVAASPAVRAAMLVPYLGLGGVGIWKAHEFDRQSRDERNTPLKSDIDQASSNALLGAAASNLAYGGFNALRDIASPQAQALKEARAARELETAKELEAIRAAEAARAAEEAKAIAETKALPAPEAAPTPRGRLQQVADAYGVQYKRLTPSKQIMNKLGDAMTGAKRGAAFDQAEKILGLDTAEGATLAERRGAIMNKLGRLAKGRFAIPLALIGGSAAAFGPGGGSAEASPYAPAPGDSSLSPAPSRGRLAMNALGRASSAVVEAAPSLAAYTVGLPAGVAYDAARSGLPMIDTPEKAWEFKQGLANARGQRNIAAAQAEDTRQVMEMQRRGFPQPLSPGERDALPPSLQHIGNPGAQDPRFQAALEEFIAAHSVGTQ